MSCLEIIISKLEPKLNKKYEKYLNWDKVK